MAEPPTMDTDASAGQVGAVLPQKQPDESTQPLGYWRRSLNAAKRSYSTTERECLAVVRTSLLLHPYIERTCFTVRTDHAALKWTLHMDGAHGKLARWRLHLAEFDYVVQKPPCASHHAADKMSRISPPAWDDGPVPGPVPCLALPNSSAAWQLQPQTEEGGLSPLTLSEFLEGHAEVGRCREVRAALVCDNKSRFREDPNGLLVLTAPLEGAAQVYVPTHMPWGNDARELPPESRTSGGQQDVLVDATVISLGIYGGGCLRLRGQLYAVCAEPRRQPT